MQNEKNELGKKELLSRVLKAFFSLTFLKDTLYTFSFHLLNRTYGIIKTNKGKNVKIRPNVLLRDPERIYLGDNTTLGTGNILWAGKESAVIKIGKNVMTGPSVKIFAFNHGVEISQTPMIEQATTEKDVIIGDNVWIGANVLIMPGCNIEDGVVIGAGSVVTKNLPKNSICAGIPAKVIKKR